MTRRRESNGKEGHALQPAAWSRSESAETLRQTGESTDPFDSFPSEATMQFAAVRCEEQDPWSEFTSETDVDTLRNATAPSLQLATAGVTLAPDHHNRGGVCVPPSLRLQDAAETMSAVGDPRQHRRRALVIWSAVAVFASVTVWFLLQMGAKP